LRKDETDLENPEAAHPDLPDLDAPRDEPDAPISAAPVFDEAPPAEAPPAPADDGTTGLKTTAWKTTARDTTAGDTTARDTTTWRSAIAEVLSDPAAETAAHPDTVASPSWRQTEEPAHENVAQTGAAAPEADPDASFTAAADSLFHPPSSDMDEPHLITLGRRLRPALATPRSLAPGVEPMVAADLSPRVSETAATSEPAPLWDRVREAWSNASWKERLRVGARYAAYAAGGYLALVLVLIVLFRFVNPPGSMLMLTQLLGGTIPHRTWVPIDSISPALVRAVVVSEDDRFCAHHGIDTDAMIQAIRQSGEGVPRGASTISMQVIKNLFLWSAKSYVRKVIEIPLTLFMELIWPKTRVLEVYLNIAEWGPGVFGAEAAARYHFSKHASQLGSAEAALLAAVLPNPIDRVAGSPGPQTNRKARVVQSRVKAYGSVASCVVATAAAPDAASPPAVTGLRRAAPPNARKSTIRPPIKRKRKIEDGWGPTLQFGY
jgi:monofunctional biosynthetic peptidoglycan transglycosylase